MPPTRTIPPAKAVKTERTHEENQERAYIAASRRSDRSLEARVESARRASEIHKRRTGRSLRVTEQDVINEEMYEEEDDDLPMQYRRLTAHLQTGSADFNRRLSAYLTSNVAMRSGLAQAINNSYAQEFSNAGQLSNQQSYYPSPLLAHQQQMMQQSMQMQSMQHSTQQPIQQPMQQPNSPSTNRQAPYSSPRPQQMMQSVNPSTHRTAPYPPVRQQQQGSPSNLHGRSASIATTPDLNGPAQPSPVVAHNFERRASMPAVKTEIKAETGAESAIQNQTPLSAPVTTPHQRPSFSPGTFSQQQNNYNFNQFSLPSYDFGAFSTTLPADSQMLLGPQFANPDDPVISAMMAGSNNFPSQFYNFGSNNDFQNATEVGKGQQMQTGIHSTVAPADLDLNQGSQGDYQSFFDQAINPEGTGDTDGTPGIGTEAWNSFINDDADQWTLPNGSQ